jgi:hypothetical protein
MIVRREPFESKSCLLWRQSLTASLDSVVDACFSERGAVISDGNRRFDIEELVVFVPLWVTN